MYLDGDTISKAGPNVRLTGRRPRLEELDGDFEALLEAEDITELNAAWLRGQADLLVLDDEELDRHIAERVSRIPDLAARQAEAAEDALLDTPESDMIIRELF